LKKLGIQVIRSKEQEGLAYVQKHIDLGWKYTNQFDLGDKVYMVGLVWEGDSEPLTPDSIPQDK
jgi:hypothetical protein